MDIDPLLAHDQGHLSTPDGQLFGKIHMLSMIPKKQFLAKEFGSQKLHWHKTRPKEMVLAGLHASRHGPKSVTVFPTAAAHSS